MSTRRKYIGIVHLQSDFRIVELGLAGCFGRLSIHFSSCTSNHSNQTNFTDAHTTRSARANSPVSNPGVGVWVGLNKPSPVQNMTQVVARPRDGMRRRAKTCQHGDIIFHGISSYSTLTVARRRNTSRRIVGPCDDLRHIVN